MRRGPWRSLVRSSGWCSDTSSPDSTAGCGSIDPADPIGPINPAAPLGIACAWRGAGGDLEGGRYDRRVSTDRHGTPEGCRACRAIGLPIPTDPRGNPSSSRIQPCGPSVDQADPTPSGCYEAPRVRCCGTLGAFGRVRLQRSDSGAPSVPRPGLGNASEAWRVS